MGNLKLFVVGESSPNPDDWGCGNRAIVVAANEDEASRLYDGLTPVTEIPMTKQLLLMIQDIPCAL